MRDRKGFTPLQHALRSPRNRECAVILLESDAYFDFEIFETEHGTLLHEMYVSEDTSHLLRLTELMLEKVRVYFLRILLLNIIIISVSIRLELILG